MPGPQRVAVVHLGPDPASEWGGIPTVVRGLFASSLADRFELSSIPTQRRVSVARRVALFARAVLSLGAFCLARGPRVVHLHVTVRGSMHRKAICVAVARALRRPVIVHVHAGAGELEAFHERLGPVRRAAFRLALRSAQRVLAVSGATAHVLEERYGARDVEVLPNAAPEPVPGEDGRVRSAGEASVLYLGGFANPVKGGRTLLAAIPPLLQRAPGVRIVLAGPGDPPAELPGGDRVEWAGWVEGEAKDERLAAADIFVLASSSEGLPMVLLEAMAHGKAIVATDVGGVRDVLEDGRDGVVVAPERPEALAEALAALAWDVERSDALREAARRRAEEIGPERIAERLAGVYEELARDG